MNGLTLDQISVFYRIESSSGYYRDHQVTKISEVSDGGFDYYHFRAELDRALDVDYAGYKHSIIIIDNSLGPNDQIPAPIRLDYFEETIREELEKRY